MSTLLTIPEPSLIALVGPSGAGKSTFAGRHFKPTEVVSSDRCRGWVCDDETEQGVNEQAFAVVHAIVKARLSLAKSVVIDATNVQPESRAKLVEIAREADLFAVAIVLDVPNRVCEDRNAARPDRQFGPHVIRGQANTLRRSLKDMRREGFKQVWILRDEEIDDVEIRRTPLWTDRRLEHGPFDIVGDVHGCMDELRELLGKLGYEPDAEGLPAHPQGRRLIFVGDLVDRGPDSVGVVELVRRVVSSGRGFCVAGNHDEKLLKKLRGKDVRIAHGLAETLAQIEALPPEERPLFRSRAAAFIDGLVSHYVLDGGKLVVAHAGLKAEYQGRSSARVRSFALFGDTTGEVDSFGLPVRHRWAHQDYRGKALVVFGHTPVPEPDRLNNTINIDTGCCFGGVLTALRYPENEVVSVPAHRVYAEPARPFLDAEKPLETLDARAGDDLLRIDDVTGKRVVSTALMGHLTIRAEQAGPALEVLTRFAADPRWLVYLPPTMAPCPASPSGPLPGAPRRGLPSVSPGRRDHGRLPGKRLHGLASRRRVDAREPKVRRPLASSSGAPSPGVILTRTGRRFFDDQSVEASMLERVATAMAASGLWDEMAADWAVLDAELMPWSAKAAGLLKDQYGPVGAAGRADLAMLVEALALAESRGVELGELVAEARERLGEIEGYITAYVQGRYSLANQKVLNGLKLAPFHLLAAGPSTFFDRDRHAWHMTTLGPARRGRPGLDRRDPLEARQSARRIRPARSDRLVVRADRGRDGRDGRQAARLRRQEPEGPAPARREGPRPELPPDHLRPRIPPARQPRKAPLPGPRPQTLAGPPRVRPRRRGPRTLRPRRAPLPGPRVHRRNPRPGSRAGRPEAMTPRDGQSGWPGGPSTR